MRGGLKKIPGTRCWVTSAHWTGLAGAEGQVDWRDPLRIVGRCASVCTVHLSESDSRVYLLCEFGVCVWFACRRKLGLHWASQTTATFLSFVSRLDGLRGKEVVTKIQKRELVAFS